LEQPLFEDLSEDGSLVLFDDEDFSEDKTDALVYYLKIGHRCRPKSRSRWATVMLVTLVFWWLTVGDNLRMLVTELRS